MTLLSVKELPFIFGLLGNILAFLVFLAPAPTFYTICKRKSSEGFRSMPYSVAFFSASLLLYYAYLKTNAYMIICVNGIGCVIEAIYLFIYVVYAPPKTKIAAARLIFLFNVGGLGLVILPSLLVVKGSKRVSLVGWMCAIVNIGVFAAPLTVMRQVIRTKSVEFMPFFLSLFLTLSATMWFFYGFFVRDYFIALPNVLGFILGIAQMILYFIYKNANKGTAAEINYDHHEESNSSDPRRDIEMNFRQDHHNSPARGNESK